ncbi:hypothetical protein UFOVP733_28 [uncultured Caudovirales phage]|uniref:Uncharacterized protein n=1 Tax=uncultured Caudovirales phage TaxID=2100421 RepID=A0A6J5NVF0_9CAUD|nr:hypothetical protein UFOVP733_28 [uncultured Caudovirales phage]CAB5224904.1 hypothetical protein UFOVP743_31 [uncultured Caudovirales phage]
MMINTKIIDITLDDSMASCHIQETLQGFSVNLTVQPFEIRVHFPPKIKTMGSFGRDEIDAALGYLSDLKRELSEGGLHEEISGVVISKKVTGEVMNHG